MLTKRLLLYVLLYIAFEIFTDYLHLRTQTIILTDTKIMARNKSFDLNKITAVELTNEMDKSTPIASSNTSLYNGIPSAAGVAAGMAAGAFNASMALSGAAYKSGSKKAYCVGIVYGNKRYYLAKMMRAIRAQALYNFLTQN